jgi:hypothetical protein
VVSLSSELIRPSAPLAHLDLIGSEDATAGAARAQLRPDDPTPQRGRAALLVPAFKAPEKVSA